MTLETSSVTMGSVHVSRRLTSRKAVVVLIAAFVIMAYLVDNLHPTDSEEQYMAVVQGREDVSESAERNIYAVLERITLVRERLQPRYDELNVDEAMLDRAILGRKYAETLERLKNTIVNILFTGKTFKIGILGASISAGAYLSDIDLMYANIYSKLMEEVFGTPVVVFNGAVGACGSNYFSYCGPAHLELDQMDLILVEFAVNDNLETADAHERMIRYALQLPNHPQLLYVHFMLGKMMRELGRCFNAEAFVLTPMSKHYNLPSISFRKAVCPALNYSSDRIFTPGDNYNHPSEVGHELTALILFHFTTNLIQNICGRILHQMQVTPTFSSESFLSENTQYSYQLPPPIFKGTRDVRFECKTTLQPRLSEKYYPVPLYVRGWEKFTPDMPKTRNDLATSWYTEKANQTIVFDAVIDEAAINVICTVSLLTMTCPTCGTARIFLNRQKLKKTIADTNDMYRKLRVIDIVNVVPGNYNLVIKTLENKPFHVIGVAKSCYDISNKLTQFS
ncbi:uncharacterized protein LOC144362324 [Saccoglossus kowalevskii]